MAQRRSLDPIFIFTDPGIDDTLALAMATSKVLDLPIIGACGVDGNVPPNLASENLARLFKLFGADDIPVFQSGIDDPKHEYPYSVHGRNGLGNVKLVKASSRISRDGMVEFIKSKGRIRILSLGPLTVVSELIEKSPEITKQISQCVIMGGGIAGGNVTPYAEFNIYSNPKAADNVFLSSIPKVLVPLDITEKVCLYSEDLELLKRSARMATRKVAKMLEFYFEFQRKLDGFFGGYMHDSTALVAMIRPDLFHFRMAEIRVDTTGKKTRGRTVSKFSNEAKHANTKIAVNVDEDSVRSVIMNTLTNND